MVGEPRAQEREPASQMDSASKEGCLEEPTFQLGLDLDYGLKIWTYRDG